MAGTCVNQTCVKDFTIDLGRWKDLLLAISYIVHLFKGAFNADIANSGRARPIRIGCGRAD
jgi:hypothetical protein